MPAKRKGHSNDSDSTTKLRTPERIQRSGWQRICDAVRDAIGADSAVGLMDDLLAIILPYVGGSIGAFDLIVAHSDSGRQTLYHSELTGSTNASGRLLSSAALTFMPEPSAGMLGLSLIGLANSRDGLFGVSRGKVYKLTDTGLRQKVWLIEGSEAITGVCVLDDELYVAVGGSIERWGSVRAPVRHKGSIDIDPGAWLGAWRRGGTASARLVRVSCQGGAFRVCHADARTGSDASFIVRPKLALPAGRVPFHCAIAGDELFVAVEKYGLFRMTMQMQRHATRGGKAPVIANDALEFPTQLATSAIRGAVAVDSRVLILSDGTRS